MCEGGNSLLWYPSVLKDISIRWKGKLKVNRGCDACELFTSRLKST